MNEAVQGEKRAIAMVADAREIINPELKGSDLSVLIDRVIEWVKTLNLNGMGSQGLHILLHFATDELVPRLIEWGPTYSDLILQMVVVPLLKKIDEQFHVEPVTP